MCEDKTSNIFNIPFKKIKQIKDPTYKKYIYLDSRLVRTDSQYIGRFESVHLVRPVMLGAVFTVSHSTATVRSRLAVRKKHVPKTCMLRGHVFVSTSPPILPESLVVQVHGRPENNGITDTITDVFEMMSSGKAWLHHVFI